MVWIYFPKQHKAELSYNNRVFAYYVFWTTTLNVIKTTQIVTYPKKIIILSEKEIEEEYQLLSKLFPTKETHCKTNRDVMPKIAGSGKDETISFADAFEDFLAETIVTTSNGKYPILGESGRGGRIINGKLIEY